jgi:glutamyl-tRNA reductase
MSVLVLGMNHRTAPPELLERVAVPSSEHAKAVRSLTSLEHTIEAAVLSTCNRVEVYAHVSRFHAGLQEITRWFADRAEVDPDAIAVAAYSEFDDRAAAHLFAVAGGLDSVIIGERQIAMQVKQAAVTARDEGSSRRVLQKLFNQALYCSRRIRSETDIMRGASSMVDVGLELAAEHLDGDLSGRDVLIVGAGKIGGLTSAALSELGAGRILVRNRTRERAERLAARVDGTVVTDGGTAGAVAEVDLVVCCAGASSPLLDREILEDVTSRRGGRPVVILDLALPRNVTVDAAELPGVDVVDLTEVRERAELSARGPATASAHAIVEEEAEAFRAWSHAVRVEPTIRALRERAEEVRRDEIERLGGRLSDLGPREREAVEALARGIVNTLLHDPTVRLKALADSGGAEHYALALRELFDLDT